MRFVGAGSGGMASPHAAACPLGLVSHIKCAVSHSKDKHITQLMGSEKPGAAEIRTGKSFRYLMPPSLAWQDQFCADPSLLVLKIPP